MEISVSEEELPTAAVGNMAMVLLRLSCYIRTTYLHDVYVMRGWYVGRGLFVMLAQQRLKPVKPHHETAQDIR